MKATGDGVLHPERGASNVAMQRRFTFGPVEEDFADAARIVRRRLRWPRSGAQPLETVGAVAEYESGAGKFTVHCNSSMYNYVGWTMALSLGVPAHKLNLVPVIAGGSFGSKLFAHKVCVLAASLARLAAGRSSTSRTASTISRHATITAPTASTTPSSRSTPTTG